MRNAKTRQPPPLWVLLGPALTALAMVSLLLSDDETVKWPAVLVLLGVVGLAVTVLAQRRTARRRSSVDGDVNRPDLLDTRER